MKTICLCAIALIIAARSQAASSSDHIDYHNATPDAAYAPIDYTPPLYSPDEPVRFNIPIYRITTGTIIHFASSIKAYEIFTHVNGIATPAQPLQPASDSTAN